MTSNLMNHVKIWLYVNLSCNLFEIHLYHIDPKNISVCNISTHISPKISEIYWYWQYWQEPVSVEP